MTIIMVKVLTAKVIRLRQMPEESIRQVFIPDHCLHHKIVNGHDHKIVDENGDYHDYEQYRIIYS